MTAPTVSVYINSGSEGTPGWYQVTGAMAMYFAGAGTTDSALSPVIAPTGTDTKIIEQLWAGSWPSYGSGIKCGTYGATADPNEPAGKQNVIQVFFQDYPTATAPQLTAWDTSSHNSTSKEMLDGTTGTTSTSWVKAIETTNGAPSAGWADVSTATAGGQLVNDLKGSTDYIQCVAIASANTSKLFNIVVYVPYDASPGTTGHDPVLTVQFTYT